MKTATLLCLIFASLSLGCSTQRPTPATHTLSGKVVHNETGEPIAGASVSVYTYQNGFCYPAEGEPVLTTVTTGTDGSFSATVQDDFPVTLVAYKGNDTGSETICLYEKDKAEVKMATYLPPPYLNDPTGTFSLFD